MTNVLNFICWALTHVDPESIPEGASLPLPLDECGVQPIHYLYGAVMRQTTRETLNERYVNHYCKTMTRDVYDNLTSSFHENEYATDCQGLCDAFWTHEGGDKTDIHAHMNYSGWCTDKGKISEIDRPYVIGEAVFCYNKTKGKMTHVGFVCGFDADGEPLAVEARSIRCGVVVTRFSDRAWTHRGLMTKKFNYESEDTGMDKPVVLAKTSPMMQGDGIRKIQEALNSLGYKDDACNVLEVDGKCGGCTMQAIRAFANAHADVIQPGEAVAPIATFTSDDGAFKINFIPSTAEA